MEAGLPALAWVVVAAGGILALLSLILAVSLWVMMGPPVATDTDPGVVVPPSVPR